MAENRISQEVVEAVVLPDTQMARVSQEVVEAVILPTAHRACISQGCVEVVIYNAGYDPVPVGRSFAVVII